MKSEPVKEKKEASGLIALVVATLCLIAIAVFAVVRLVAGGEQFESAPVDPALLAEAQALPPLAARAEANRLQAVNRALEQELRTVRTSTHAPARAPGEAFRASAPEATPDVALAFPVNVPDVYLPRAFEELAHRAAAECGMKLEVFAIDCSEFPCIAWTEAKDASVQRFSMTGCKVWEDAFPHGTSVVGSVRDADGASGKRYLSWMPMPPDPADQMIALQRAKERTRGMRDALGAQ